MEAILIAVGVVAVVVGFFWLIDQEWFQLSMVFALNLGVLVIGISLIVWGITLNNPIPIIIEIVIGFVGGLNAVNILRGED